MNATTWQARAEPINYSKERRELVAMLIETGLSDDEFCPTKVLPRVPRGRYRDVDLVADLALGGSEGKRLTQEAPAPVQQVLAENRLHQIQRKMPTTTSAGSAP